MHKQELDEQLRLQLRSKSKEKLINLLIESTDLMIELQEVIEDVFDSTNLNYGRTIGDERYERAEEFLNQFAERY